MTPAEDRRVTLPAPLYVVAAPLGRDAIAIQPPVVAEVQPGTFDEDLLPAIAGVWYSMHLPKNRFETLDLPLSGVQDQLMGFPRPHSIALIPDALLDMPELMERLVSRFDPTLIIASAERLESARAISSQLKFTLPPANLDEIDQSTLEDHWRMLAANWLNDWPPGAQLEATTPRWNWPVGLDGSRLPLQRLARMMAVPLEAIRVGQSPDGSASRVRRLHVQLNALVDLEQQGVGPDDAAEALPDALREQSQTTRPRLTLSLSGTAPRYLRLSSVADGVTQGAFQDDYSEIRSLLVNYSASADNSMGMVLEDALTPEAFHAVADLERHWTEGPRPAAVKRLLQRIDRATADLWTEDFVAAVRCASSIDAFTNFPIGLLTFPGDSSPLSTRIAISYRSINPLTRALQFELSPHPPRTFRAGFRVLVAECIPSTDRVGQASRQGWTLISEEMSSSGDNISLAVVETLTKDALRAAISGVAPDVLVLSAHGLHAPDSNVAGVVVGENEFTLGDDLGEMPPLVILSACHTSPRGGGVVSVGDLLLRSGADAVLSTLVPVDVRHNAQTVARLFRYLALAASDDGTPLNTSLLDVWHQVQALNVVNDLTYSNRSLSEWAFQRVAGSSPIEEFLTGEHGMRRGRLYEDAEARLIDIAARTGDDERVRSWLRAPGYLPESLMYVFLGRPSSLLVGVASNVL